MTASELVVLRHELVARLAAIYKTARKDGDEAALLRQFSREPEDESDDASADELDVMRGELGDRDAQLAVQIRDALHRMHDGTYGVCLDCDQPIPFERLRAVPWTERCAVDQTAADGERAHTTL